MEQRPTLDHPSPFADPPSQVTVTVISDGSRAPLRVAGPWLLAAAVVVAAAIALATSGGRAQISHAASRRIAARIVPFTTQSPAGIDAIGVLFRNSLQCMKLTFAPSETSYFLASPSGACSHPVSDRVEVFHQVGNQVRLVLDGDGQACTGAPIPALVQVELGVCRGSAASLYSGQPPPGRTGHDPQGGPFRPSDA
jgi:hypothetical protein